MANNYGNLRDRLPEIIGKRFDANNSTAVNFLQTLLEGLIDQLQTATTTKKSKEFLIRSLGQVDKDIFSDTEEREGIVDIFSEFSSIVGVNISKEINYWMYGKVLGSAANLLGMLKQKSGPILKESCRNCNTELQLVVDSQNSSVPDHWEIVSCNNCKSRNLFNMDCNAAEVSYINCLHSQTLMQSDYSREQAERML